MLPDPHLWLCGLSDTHTLWININMTHGFIYGLKMRKWNRQTETQTDGDTDRQAVGRRVNKVLVDT